MAKDSLTEAEIEVIAERAAQKALAKVYQEVGKSAVKTVLWVIGSITLTLLAYLGGKGIIRP